MTGVSQALPPTELTGDGGPVTPLKNAAMITKTDVGYRYIAGQQNSRLTITTVDGKLRYVDKGTRELRKIPKSCSRQAVSKGISALCNIPAKFGGGNKMFLEVWPRLGDDFVDGSTLTATFRLWVLGDRGDDTVLGGDGDDFVNGAQDNDKAWGGAGDDWIRTGKGNDKLWGGAGDDKLVGVHGNDVIYGGDGDDRVGGGPGRDVLWGDAGQDFVACGGGRDRAHIDGSDRTSKCESVLR
ncbi:MAG TPA: calcium-binding protein [Nocardioidaceae bacterium]|nr:calcium-binding protein [Nocardioidaceae bacterium]